MIKSQKCNMFSNCKKTKSTSDKLQIFMFLFDTVKCDGSDEEEVKVSSELSVNIFFWLLPGLREPRKAIQEQSISFFGIRTVKYLNQFEHFISNFFLDTRIFVLAWLNAGGWVDTHWGTTRSVRGPRTVVLFVFKNCWRTIFRRLHLI